MKRRDPDYDVVEKVPDLFEKTVIQILFNCFIGLNFILIALGVLPGYKLILPGMRWYVKEGGQGFLYTLGVMFLIRAPGFFTEYRRDMRDTEAVIGEGILHLLSCCFVGFISFWWIGVLVFLAEYLVGTGLTIAAHWIHRSTGSRFEYDILRHNIIGAMIDCIFNRRLNKTIAKKSQSGTHGISGDTGSDADPARFREKNPGQPQSAPENKTITDSKRREPAKNIKKNTMNRKRRGNRTNQQNDYKHGDPRHHDRKF